MSKKLIETDLFLNIPKTLSVTTDGSGDVVLDFVKSDDGVGLGLGLYEVYACVPLTDNRFGSWLINYYTWVNGDTGVKTTKNNVVILGTANITASSNTASTVRFDTNLAGQTMYFTIARIMTNPTPA